MSKQNIEIVINSCYGGFCLSKKACEILGFEWNDLVGMGEDSEVRFSKEWRTDPRLIDCVKKLRDGANGPFAKLKIVKVPIDVEWEITDYDGLEAVEEVHRVWN